MKLTLRLVALLVIFSSSICLQVTSNELEINKSTVKESLILPIFEEHKSEKPEQVIWISPGDGGTPRDLNRIKTIGENEFHIRASFEDGGSSVLKHPVSRMDLVCKNESSQTVKVKVHIDLSDDGKRTDYDNRPEAGMPERNYIFIQSPGNSWQQVNGSSEGFIATVSFNALPGETKIGLSPWYTYGDYLHFVNALPQHPYLSKKMIGRSDENREHWELTITDPEVQTEYKKTIFWHAREHGYETFSSFAMEGLIEYLLSDSAEDFRKQYIFVIHPMTNLDGVANGFEYRKGYDHPDVHGTATARLSFETIDRLKPDFAVTWHNWGAPRDRNVVFYTDEENGEPSARAWYRFMQLFPSIRSAGHRWTDENTPIKYNWQGRNLSLDNLHQYAMKKYGTKVWGWEMPWWNLTVRDAHKAGSDFAYAFLTTINEIRNDTIPAMEEHNVTVEPRWGMQQFSVKSITRYTDPFLETTLVGEFTSPTGKTMVVDGFYDGDNIWKLRFVPDEEGEWSYHLRGEGVEILAQGELHCSPPITHGFIRIHPQNNYSFAYSDGTPFFPMGDTCYGLHDDSPITPALRDKYLKIRRSQRFNFIRMSVGHSYERAQKDPLYWAWGGTPTKPDLDSFNPLFFRSLDELLVEMRNYGMNAELLLLNFYRLPFTDPKQWTRSRERLWLQYLLARYSAFDNIFMWTISNEYETHPDGEYRLDVPDDIDWVKATAKIIKLNDPYNHLVTVHPNISASTYGIIPGDSIDYPWRIGEFFGNVDELDILSQQTGQSGKGITWNNKLKCWTGDDPNLVASINADRKFNKPVMNTENGYEYLIGTPTEKNQVHHTDKVRRSAWRIACAGGYFAAGFNGTIGHNDIWNRIDAPNQYTFTVKDEGAASQLGFLYNFFNNLPFWKMQPFKGVTGNAVALSENGKIYVIYLPYGGSVKMDLSETGSLNYKWYNPRTGKYNKPKVVSGGSMKEFTAPDNQDWVLLLSLNNS